MPRQTQLLLGPNEDLFLQFGFSGLLALETERPNEVKSQKTLLLFSRELGLSKDKFYKLREFLMEFCQR